MCFGILLVLMHGECVMTVVRSFDYFFNKEQNMNQKTSNESIRFAPVALALVLLVFLGFLALRVHAEGLEVGSEEVRQMIADKAEEQRQLLKEMQQEYLLALEDVSQERLRVNEEREEIQNTFVEQRSAFEIQRAKALETYRSLLGEKKNELREKVEEHKKERELKKEEYKAHLSLSAQVRVGQYVERIVFRMDTAIVRLEQIAKRLETRIEKIEGQGVDVSEAKVDLRNIYVLIEDAHEYVELIGDVSTEVLTSEKPKEQAQEIREAVGLAKDSIVTIHKALSETVQNIKVGIEKKEVIDETETEQE